MEILHQTAGDFTVFSGWDSITLESLFAGARGVLSGGSNCFPDVMVKLFNLVDTGKHVEAREFYRKVRPLLVLLEDHGRLAAWIKGTVRLLHHDVGLPRRPYLPLLPDEEALIRKTLAEVGLL
jgi:4-hydroxy-tetrahydrodipicolinate synthase